MHMQKHSVYVGGGQTYMQRPGVYVQCITLLPIVGRQGLPLNPELVSLTRLAGEPLPLFPHLWGYKHVRPKQFFLG